MEGHTSLFRFIPPWVVVLKVLTMLKISTSFPTTFQRQDIQLTESVYAVAELEPYYIPCKAKRFLEFTNASRWITIFRHILSPHGYCIISKETTRNGKKAIFYTIERSAGLAGPLKQPICLDFS
jgi:hypothetical protein